MEIAGGGWRSTVSISDQVQDEWIERLSTPETRDAAISELHQILLRGLGKSFATRSAGSLQIEDIAQEAMLKILDSLHSFAGRSRFTTWAMTIATRVGISELRRKHYQDVSLDALTAGDSLAVQLAADNDAGDDHQERARILRILHHLIQSDLSAKQREAIAALLGGLPVEEIASRSGSNRNAVYKLIHDARARLKAGFERSGLMTEDVSAIFA